MLSFSPGPYLLSCCCYGYCSYHCPCHRFCPCSCPRRCPEGLAAAPGVGAVATLVAAVALFLLWLAHLWQTRQGSFDKQARQGIFDNILAQDNSRCADGGRHGDSMRLELVCLCYVNYETTCSSPFLYFFSIPHSSMPALPCVVLPCPVLPCPASSAAVLRRLRWQSPHTFRPKLPQCHHFHKVHGGKRRPRQNAPSPLLCTGATVHASIACRHQQRQRRRAYP